MKTKNGIPNNNVIDNYKKEYAEFIEIASHDLDTPLRKLSYLVEKVTDKYKKDPEEEVQTYVKKIETCLADMRSMIDGLTKLYRVTADKRESVPCDLKTVVENVYRELQREGNEEKVAINFSSLPVVEGDMMQYRQLFKNLFENAIRFRKKDIPATIRVHAESLADKEKSSWGLQQNKKYFKIDILDKGIGFKQEDAEKIFNPFVRLNGKSQFAGNGIGLAICRKITDIHHGIIYAEGRENEEAKFILILPESQS
ncbi:MAG TPA: ATP-binding protein [Chitinophagaceae bacterium]|nr:ATP-binding protein [Chitinophagaceae bacterium]